MDSHACPRGANQNRQQRKFVLRLAAGRLDPVVKTSKECEMGQTLWRHKLTRALSKRRLALAEPNIWQREGAPVCLDVLPSIINSFLLKGNVVCYTL